MWGFLAGLVTSIFGALLNNKFGQQRESDAREENYFFGEQSAQNADARTRALYSDLQSPQALAQQYKDAGLSPSLMFGGGGVGGQTTQGAQGAGAAGVSPTTFGIDPLAGAQLDLIKAQTAKTNAETDAINKKTPVEIKELLSNIGVKDSESLLNRLHYSIEDALQATTVKQAQTDLILAQRQVMKINWEIVSKGAQAQIDVATINEKIQEASLNNKLIAAQIDRELSQANLNDETARLMRQKVLQSAAEISQGWMRLSIEQSRVAIEQNRQWTYEDYVRNLNDYMDEQVRIQSDRLNHEIHYDWGSLITNTVRELISLPYQSIENVIMSGAL